MEYASSSAIVIRMIHEDDVVIAISQSGETADTLAAIELAKGAFIYGMQCGRFIHSAHYRYPVLYSWDPEIGSGVHQGITGRVTVLTMLADTGKGYGG